MAIKSFKPYSAGRRFMTVASFDEITTDKPEKSLVERLKKNGGRNQQGRLTVRHQGGGHKRLYRIIDFRRNRMVFQPRLLLSSTIQTAVHVLHF